jgi:site-specific DNA recombinase
LAIIVDGYCRVSTDPQETNTSLDEQEASIREYCREHDLILAMIHRETWSGYEYRERDKLSLMRERYQSGKIQGVIIRTYDRLSRKEVHLGILMEEMDHLGVQLHCVKESIDDSLLGRLTRLFLGFLAEWEWEKIRERTSTGRINKAKQGKIVAGNKLPYGWRWQLNDKGEKEVVLHNLTQLWKVRWMALQFDRGTPTNEIARTLTARGIPTPEGEPGKPWHPMAVRRILSNERLIGKGKNFAYQMNPAKQRYDPIDLPDGTYPAIISEELFLRLQDRLSRTKDEAVRHNEHPEEFLLRAGYIRCELCGRRMSAHVDRRKVRRNGGEYHYVYRCNRHDRLGNKQCKGQDVDAKAVDAWTEAKLLVVAEHTALLARAIELATSTQSLAADAKVIDTSLAHWQQKIQNYLEDLEDTTLRGDSRAAIRQSLNIANEHIEQLKEEQAQVLLGMIDWEREKAAYHEILLWCNKVKEARDELTYQQKRDFLHLLGAVVYTKRGEGDAVICRIEVELPEIRELISSAAHIEAHHSETMPPC